jgi:hypothetical protein
VKRRVGGEKDPGEADSGNLKHLAPLLLAEGGDESSTEKSSAVSQSQSNNSLALTLGYSPNSAANEKIEKMRTLVDHYVEEGSKISVLNSRRERSIPDESEKTEIKKKVRR